MARKLALTGKTKVKLTNIVVQALKAGQKDLKPAITIRCKWRAPSTALDMLDGTLRPFLFRKPSAPAKQAAIEGVPPVSELTDAGMALGAFDWAYEQTGCTFKIYRGATGNMNIRLRDATVKKVKVTPHEGDAVDVEWSVYAADLDEETMGALACLKQHEVDCELELPEPLQQDIEQPAAGKGKRGQQLTPLQAMQQGEATTAH